MWKNGMNKWGKNLSSWGKLKTAEKRLSFQLNQPKLPTPHDSTLTFMVCSTVAILTLGGGFGGSILGIGNLPLGPAGLQKCFGQKGNISDYLGWFYLGILDHLGLMIIWWFVGVLSPFQLVGNGISEYLRLSTTSFRFQVEALYSSLYRWGLLHFRYLKCWWDYPPTASEKFWTYFQVVCFFNFKRSQQLCFRTKKMCRSKGHLLKKKLHW